MCSLVVVPSFSECVCSLQIHGDTVQNQLVVQGVELPSYLPLYSPAMDWIFQCISYHAPEVSALVSADTHLQGRMLSPSVLCGVTAPAHGPDVERSFPTATVTSEPAHPHRGLSTEAGAVLSAPPRLSG